MRSLRTTVAVALLAVVAAGCASDPGDEQATGGRPDTAQEWRRLPDPPLTPRDHAVVVGVDGRMLVVGGWEFLCPPNADCSTPEGPLLDDGAVYDPATNSWATIAAPPFGLRRQEYATAELDGSAWVLTGCANGPRCGAQPRLLSYDLDGDRWTDHGPVPGPQDSRHLVVVGRTLLLHAGSDEYGESPDLVFDPRRAEWSELPDDPLPRTFDRFIVSVGGQLVLAGSSIAALDAGADPTKLVATFDLATREWEQLPDAPGQGYQLLPTDRGPLLNGHFIDSPGWILDPGTWTWTELPEHAGEHQDLSGVLDRDRATYDIPNSVGQMATAMRLFVYDSDAEELVDIPALPGRADVYDDSSTALGRDLFVYGGQRWQGDGATGGELVGDAWLWTAPAPG